MPWFDGLERTSRVFLVDEYAEQLSLPFLLRLLDPYPIQLPVKGGFIFPRYSTIVFTSNIDPHLWYQDALPQHRAAFLRRVRESIVMEFGSFVHMRP